MHTNIDYQYTKRHRNSSTSFEKNTSDPNLVKFIDAWYDKDGTNIEEHEFRLTDLKDFSVTIKEEYKTYKHIVVLNVWTKNDKKTIRFTRTASGRHYNQGGKTLNSSIIEPKNKFGAILKSFDIENDAQNYKKKVEKVMNRIMELTNSLEQKGTIDESWFNKNE